MELVYLPKTGTRLSCVICKIPIKLSLSLERKPGMALVLNSHNSAVPVLKSMPWKKLPFSRAKFVTRMNPFFLNSYRNQESIITGLSIQKVLNEALEVSSTHPSEEWTDLPEWVVDR